MKKFIALLALAAMISGCTSKNEYGDCIGAFDDKRAGVEYKMSTWNVVMAVIFIETIIVPIVVVADKTRCPIAPR